MPQTSRYHAHLADRAHGHVVEAESFAAAAVVFTELHTFATDDDLRVIVREVDGGPEHCFIIPADHREVQPCA